ncbi:hypothetical protein BDN71DRAFT_1592365 [Pleurotus eryngii]|uniref:Uncharacterized protein n=1 Tax=Pleurotus eryngii TaxID=5323 RepID=A0A9P5ZPN4_PLEER|nr:hypothetical protein BDN71DRAFT_1592365 [Pleurotus eryngii]
MGVHPVYNLDLPRGTHRRLVRSRSYKDLPPSYTSISCISKDSLGQEEKRNKWPADVTHFRARKKLNASKTECEPSEGDHEERTSGLAQSEKRFTLLLLAFVVANKAVGLGCYPTSPFHDGGLEAALLLAVSVTNVLPPHLCSAFAFLASLAGALQMQPLENAHTQGDVRVTWISEADDASRFAAFSVFLHHPSFSSDFAILNNQRSADGGANVTLPAVPVQAGYTLRATDVGNINNEFAASSPFSIGPEVSTSSSTPSSTSAPGTASGSGTVLSVPPTSAFGMTVSSPTASSRPGTAGASGAGWTGSGTNTAAQEGATNSNANGAMTVGMWSWVLSAAVVGLGWAVGPY